MKKYFVFSDVHGFYKELIQGLSDAGFDKNNPEHVIVSLGDLLDRGEEPLLCLKFVNSIPEERKILVRGNHEDLLEDCFTRREFRYHDYHNGTTYTVLALGEYSSEAFSIDEVFDKAIKNPDWIEYQKHLVDYAETKDYIFVHSFIPLKEHDIKTIKDIHEKAFKHDPDWRKATSHEWKTARWYNPFDLEKRGFNKTSKILFHGHWGNEYGNKNKESCDVYDTCKHGNCIGLDTTTCLSHKVNVFAFEDEE